MSAPSRRRYWRNLGLALAVAVLLGGCALAAFVAFSSARYAAQALDPPRAVLDRWPEDVGITAPREVMFSVDGLTLRGWYVPARNGAAIILAHGYGGNRLDLLPEAGLLAAAGYGVLLFDFRGHGASDDAPVTLGRDERRDLVAVLDFVAAQPEVDPARIGAIGFSMGGATLAGVATHDERLRAAVIEAAFDTLDGVISQSAGLLGPLSEVPARWSLRREGLDIDAVRPVDDLCAISPRPVLLIYGARDDVIPPGAAEAMFAAACDPVETWLIPGAGHENYLDYAGEAYAARLLAFFEAHLGP